MKITLQSTVENNKTIEPTNPMVSIDIPFDDLTISEVVEYLIKPALLGYGFMNETIEDYFNNHQ